MPGLIQDKVESGVRFSLIEEMKWKKVKVSNSD
jgi:hypothetical protein